MICKNLKKWFLENIAVIDSMMQIQPWSTELKICLLYVIVELQIFLIYAVEKYQAFKFD